MLETRALWFHRYHFMYDIFDQKLQQYIEADLINFNALYYKNSNNPKVYEKFEEPFAVLTLAELEAGFVVCLFPLVLSIHVFAFEWMQTVKNFVLCLFIFKTFFEVKQFEQKSYIESMKFAANLIFSRRVLRHSKMKQVVSPENEASY